MLSSQGSSTLERLTCGRRSALPSPSPASPLQVVVIIYIFSQHDCHQYNHCHRFYFFSHLLCTFRWLVSKCILDAPIPKLVVFQKPFGESEEKSLTLPWNYNSSGSYRPFGASASSSTLSSTTTTTSGESVIQVLKLIVEMRKKIKSVTRL